MTKGLRVPGHQADVPAKKPLSEEAVGERASGLQRKALPVRDEPVRDEDRPSETKQRVRSGWTVIEQFERDGFHYRVTRRPAELSGNGPRLTKREVQALEYACAGYSNKGIAYALGVAPSTVGVLLFRAAAKLGVKSRRELLSAYSRLKNPWG